MLDLRSDNVQNTRFQFGIHPPRHAPLSMPSKRSRRPALITTNSDRQHHEHSNKHTPKGSAMCVQKFDDSQSSAIRITYRISLRSSSFQKPRYPSPIVVFFHQTTSTISKTHSFHTKFQRTPYQFTKMILPQVHLRKPCYDFTFL